MTTDETDKLAMRMKRLDEAAVGEFAREFGPRLRRYFLRKGVAESEAESLAVSCVSDVWLKLDRFSPRAPGGFEAWVFTLARNALADDRRGGWAGAQALPDGPGPAQALEDNDNDPASADAGARVREVLAGLPEVDRTILRLRYLEGELSFAQIGRHLDLTENAARVRHHRAVRALSARLSP